MKESLTVKFINSGYRSIEKFLEDEAMLDEDGSPIVSTQFSASDRPEHAIKKDELEIEEK